MLFSSLANGLSRSILGTPVSSHHYSTIHPRVQTVMKQLDRIAPRFSLNEGKIRIIQEPADFYDNLTTRISQAETRIFLSSLYIGKGQDNLVNCLRDALNKKPNLKLFILTDALRGTREAPGKCSASVLASLTKEFGNRVDIRMYHTPNLSGIEKVILPKRINEGWGLQHMKLYGFDNRIILSGANLSADYFTNRQDRYYEFDSEEITNYYFNIHRAISSLSYKLQPSSMKQKFRLTWPHTNNASEPHLNQERFLSDSFSTLEPLIKPPTLTEEIKSVDEDDTTATFVYPISQFTPLLKPDISTEKPAILRILSLLDSKDTRWYFTAGYFNIYPQYKEKLLKSQSSGHVIAAAPEANGFYKSHGISKYLPPAYTYLAKAFLLDIQKYKRTENIGLYEWQKGIVNTLGGWSYHAKGIWICNPNENKPCLTVIGSSNYTRRAYSLDLETNAVIVTRDEQLKNAMRSEVDNILKNTKQMAVEDYEKEDRKVSLGVQLATKIVGEKL